MKFIAQPYRTKQCGQACLAMVTGKTVNEVCKDLEHFWGTDITKDFEPYLQENGFETELVSKKFFSFDEVPNNSILRLWWLSDKGHFVVKHNDEYYDPATGIIKEYLIDVKVNHYIHYRRKPKSL